MWKVFGWDWGAFLLGNRWAGSVGGGGVALGISCDKACGVRQCWVSSQPPAPRMAEHGGRSSTGSTWATTNLQSR